MTTKLHYVYTRALIRIHEICPGKYESEQVSEVNYFSGVHAFTHFYSDFVICANIYLQKLKSYSANKKKQISENYKIQNVQNMNVR